MEATPSRKRRSKAQIKELLSQFLSSGLTQSAFATLHDLPQGVLSRLLKNSRQLPNLVPQELQRFVEVELPASPAAAAYKLVFPSGLRLEVPTGFASSELATLLSLLGLSASMRHHATLP